MLIGKRVAAQPHSLNMGTDESGEFDDDELENDEELQSELSKLVEVDDVYINRSRPDVSPIPHSRPVPPIPPRKDISPEKLLAASSKRDEVVGLCTRMERNNIESNIGHSVENTSSQLDSVPAKKEPTIRTENKELPMQVASVNNGPYPKLKLPNVTSTEISPKDKIKQVLIKRRVRQRIN